MTITRPQPSQQEREPNDSLFRRPDYLKDRKAFAEKVAKEGAVRMEQPGKEATNV